MTKTSYLYIQGKGHVYHPILTIHRSRDSRSIAANAMGVLTAG